MCCAEVRKTRHRASRRPSEWRTDCRISSWGSSGRDALWRHPDLLPTAEALTDPVRFARLDATGSGDAMDVALAELLDSAGQIPDGETDQTPGRAHEDSGEDSGEGPHDPGTA